MNSLLDRLSRKMGGYSPSTPFFFDAGLAGAAVVGMMLFVRE